VLIHRVQHLTSTDEVFGKRSVSGWMFMVPQQHLLLELVAPEARTMVLSLNSGALYLGATVGGVLGGVILAEAGPGWMPVVGSALVCVLVLLAVVAHRQVQAHHGR
jgi:predicted MFS family arabinose efflux permease